jgi:hypothetical protein
LAYVPSGATIVAFANLGEVMKSDVRKHLQEALPTTGEGKDELQKEIGVDLDKDVDSVVAGFGSGPTAAGQPGTSAVSPASPASSAMMAAQKAASETIVLIRGHFDQARIEAHLHEHGGATEDYKGKHLFEETVSASNGHSGAVAFLEPGLIALGSVTSIERAIDARESGDNIRKNADVMKFVANLDPTSNAWITGRLDAVTATAGLPAEARDRLAAVQWFAVSARVDHGVSGVLQAEARDDQSGEDLRAVVRGGLAAARLMGGQNAKLDIAINSLQLSGTGKDLSLSFTVPPEVFDVANGIAGLKKLAGHR